MEKNQHSTDKAIEAVHDLYKAVENLYDANLMSTTRSALSVIYVLLARKRELEKEQLSRHLKVVEDEAVSCDPELERPAAHPDY